ncbi:MAG: ferrous iron transport protein A [Clostridiales bacterium]|nr:ferrous iron transport protein A [Clostridiales bacterium]
MILNLYDAPNGSIYTVVDIPEENILESIGIFPGAQLKIESRYSFGGPVTVALGSRNIAIGKALAKKIAVERCYNE